MYEVLEKLVDSQSKITQIEINHQHITYQQNKQSQRFLEELK